MIAAAYTIGENRKNHRDYGVHKRRFGLDSGDRMVN